MGNKTKKGHLNKEIKAEVLKLIRKNPGIRPRELHQILGIEHSANIRSALIKQGLVQKQRKGVTVHYYPAFSQQKT